MGGGFDPPVCEDQTPHTGLTEASYGVTARGAFDPESF